MKLRYLVISAFALCFIHIGCKQKQIEEEIELEDLFTPKHKNQLVDLTQLNLSWLEGNWKDSMTWAHLQSQIIEIWRIEDSIIFGTGLQIKNINDTITAEKIRIDLKQNPVYFIAEVAGNNTPQTFRYQLKSFGVDSVCFENKALQFPQTITYKKSNERAIRATVSGNISGTIRRQSTFLKRY
ncbi:MAG: DUF6265 family protein [Flavobacteriales bacterium]|nr:DUF6265 family protein [Flavobacteriales bacterium]